MTEPVRFGAVFNKSRAADLLHQVEQLNVLQAQLQSLLPNEMRSRIRVANLRDHQLVVFVADAAIATHLRFDQRRILDDLSPLLPDGIDRLSVRVRPDFAV